ncbi:MAG: hypothetical protein LBK50_02660 [Candidatus Nomurabacteria bacterium]|jgi:hypothetical protein|nr:hypothetical protein [Candidatus Nomurabacteria bacterium]
MRERVVGEAMGEIERLGEEAGLRALVGKAETIGTGIGGNKRKKAMARSGGKETRGTKQELVRILGSLERKLVVVVVVVVVRKGL